MIDISCLGSMSDLYYLLSAFLYCPNLLLQGGIPFMAQGRNKDGIPILERKQMELPKREAKN